MENLKLTGFNYSWIDNNEAVGLSKCFEAYAKYCSGDSIFEIGFNANRGYTYISLEMKDITICSMLNGEVKYLFTDFDNLGELFFKTYKEAVLYSYQLTK
jgi:hypothetical protein